MIFLQRLEFGNLVHKISLTRINLDHFEDLTIKLIRERSEVEIKGKEEQPPSCRECHDDTSTVESLIDHLVAVVNDESFERPEIKNRVSCPVCTKEIAQRNTMMNHLRNHVKVAHDGTTLCQMCNVSFSSVAKNLDHQKDHFRLVFCPAETGGNISFLSIIWKL